MSSFFDEEQYSTTLRLVFDGPAVENGLDALYDVARDLLGVHTLLTVLQMDVSKGQPRPTPTSHGFPTLLERGVKVRSVKLESPLEVVLTVSAAVGTLPALANRLIGVFNNYQDARRNSADTRVYLSVSKLIEEDLRAGGAFPPGKNTDAILQSAAETITRLRTLEVLGGGSAEKQGSDIPSDK